MAPKSASLKLLIDTEGQRVIFAEASKDFFDFMFGIMSMTLFEEGMAGCLGNLYGSMEDLEKTYIKSALTAKIDLYCCRVCCYPRKTYFSTEFANCGTCNSIMCTQAYFVKPPPLFQGYEAYMIMDDLVVKPMSTISSINMRNSFNVKEDDCLEERVVKLSMDEGVKLLRASLRSKTVLTDFFLKS